MVPRVFHADPMFSTLELPQKMKLTLQGLQYCTHFTCILHAVIMHQCCGHALHEVDLILCVKLHAAIQLHVTRTKH